MVNTGCDEAHLLHFFNAAIASEEVQMRTEIPRVGWWGEEDCLMLNMGKDKKKEKS